MSYALSLCGLLLINVPPSLCSTSACEVQFNCFLVQRARVTSRLRGNAMKKCTCACVMVDRRCSAHADVE